jgi:hypothetical protein
MRFSVPNIPPAILSNAAQRNVPNVSPSEAVQRISSFLSSGRAAVLTGAGVSVDSGVKAYRGKDGRYMNPDYKCAESCQYPVLPNSRPQRSVSGRFSWALSPPSRVSLTASIYSTRSSSKIALGDIHFGKPILVVCSTNGVLHAAPRQRYWCVFCA